jgi:hypothetical protein
MKNVAICACMILAGCATTSGGIRTMSYEEAAVFENSLLARGSEPIGPPERLFTQPVNKTEPCKLPTNKAQLERKNFRAYWDGDCKNGFAYGLGRDIAISDTHHVEEITIHGGSEDDYANQPWVLYDFVNNQTAYGVRGEKYPATSGLNQFIQNDQANFTTTFWLGLTDKAGNRIFLATSPFAPRKVYVNGQRSGVAYQLTDFTDAPAASNAVLRAIEIIDGKTSTAGGVRIVQFRNGVVEHQKLGPGGQVVERAAIPQEYVNHLASKVAEAQEAIATANVSVQKAQQMEREYLYMACNGKHPIKGLDNATATKICNWRDQFKEPYEKALVNYQHQMEQQRQQAAAQEQQLAQLRMYQAQLAQQQAIANQQAWQNFNNTLQNTTNQINQQTQQLMQWNNQMMQQNNQNMQNWAPQQNDQITCIRNSTFTTCK